MHDVALENPQAADQISGPQQLALHKASAVYPDMTGHWRLVTDFGDYQINSSLDVTQHGRKVTGTLTNDGQIPGKFKGKFEKPDAKSDSIEGDLVALALNPAINSKHLIKLTVAVAVLQFVKNMVGEWLNVDDNGKSLSVHGTSLN